MQIDLVARLRADIALSGIMGATPADPRVHWLKRPIGQSLPAITLTQIATEERYTQAGKGEWRQTTVQFDVWSAEPLGGITVLDRLQALLESGATTGSTQFCRAFLSSGPRDLRPTEIKGGELIHQRTADFRINHKPAN